MQQQEKFIEVVPLLCLAFRTKCLSTELVGPSTSLLFSSSFLSFLTMTSNEGYLFYDAYTFSLNITYFKAFIGVCDFLVQNQDQNGLWMQVCTFYLFCFPLSNLFFVIFIIFWLIYQWLPNSYPTFHERFNLWYAESLLQGYNATSNIKYLNVSSFTRLFAIFFYV